MHQDNKCYLVHENKHNATLDYIYIYKYIYIWIASFHAVVETMMYI